MKWNMTTDQVIKSLIYMANEERVVSSMEIAQNIRISPGTVVQNFSLLHGKGLVDVLSGNAGGYYLAKNSKEITLHDIIVSLEGESIFPNIRTDNTLLQYTYSFIENSMYTIFKNITLEQLSKGNIQSIEHSNKQSLNQILSHTHSIHRKKNPSRECLSSHSSISD